MDQDAGRLIPTRATLLERLKNWQDQASWQQFFDNYWQLIYGVARKAGLTESEAEEVVQETMFSVAKHMPTFKYDPAIGSFKAWLLKMTRWRIIAQLRKRGPQGPGPASWNDTGTRAIEKVADPASPSMDELWEADWQTSLFKAAIANVKLRSDPQKFQLFDFYVSKEWAAEKVARTFGVSVDQVYLAKHRISEMIKAEVERLEKEMT